MPLLCMSKPESFEKLSDEDITIVDKEEHVANKFLTLANMLQLTVNDFQERRRIVHEIMRFLRPYYPECVLEMFGSSVNGFGFKGCDLDLLFLPFPRYCNIDFTNCEDTSTPCPNRVMKGTYPRDNLYKMNEKSHLRFVMRVMYTQKWFFREVFFIPAKCPILNIQFASNDIKCDFSCSNRLVLCNTALLSLFGKLDSRVKPLVISLRYWAKSVGLIKKSQLSSYAFTMMVIFALQNTNPPILPSVKKLSELAGFSFKIDDWETAIPANMNIFLYSQKIFSSNTSSFEDLLVHFFDFYWNFDFIQNVISPHFGRPLPVKELFESSDERIREFQVTSFSIQDPFVLSRNISRNKTMKTSFQLSLLIAKDLIIKSDFSIRNFLDAGYYQKKIDWIHAPVSRGLMEPLVCNSLSLNYNICLKLGITDQLQLWYEKVSQTAYEVLTYGLLMQCEVVDKIIWPKKCSDWSPRKKQKTGFEDNILKSHGKLELISCIQCAAFFQTWNFRKKVKIPKDISVDIDICETLKKEYIISKLLIPESYQIEKSPLLWFMCNIYRYASPQISDIMFLFTPLASDSSLEGCLSNFLKSYIPKTIESVLHEN